MKKIAIIGAGISGISAAKLLAEDFDISVFEKESTIGGLIKCEDINGNLFHRVGGHVFNTKVKEVSEWFWKHFDKEKDFLQAKRNAKILLNNTLIDYPLENYLYQLDEKSFKKIMEELQELSKASGKKTYDNFEDFLKGSFGDKLYHLYFKPYNAKIWKTDLRNIPLEWLEGKLPMPDIEEILINNKMRKEEEEMVHATFYYPKKGGSQFIINTIAKGLKKIFTNTPIKSIQETTDGFILSGDRHFDKVVFTGDVRQLHSIYRGMGDDLTEALQSVKNLKSNGTSNIFCETDDNDISWLYLPDITKAHRIIYTGNFSSMNNQGSKRKTCVVEFSGKYSFEEMKEEIKMLPGNLTPLAYNYEPNSYVIHEKDTKEKINHLKNKLELKGFYLTGRFAEWEYYNMDKSIEASMNVRKKILKNS
ncbi:MAG: NAD(P)-binding protein [Cytophagaceae bacterium]|nr:NAD(P)-binding protein [Cytophagaceae bacterium]